LRRGIALFQFVPFEHHLPAGGFVLATPGGQHVETGVVDVIEMLDLDVHLGPGRHRFQRAGQLRDRHEGRRSVQVDVDPAGFGVDRLVDAHMGE
jgi:hypothetical protein